MLQKFNSGLAAFMLALSSLLFTPLAFATGTGGVDVSGVVSSIEGAAAPIAAIGGAVLVVLVGIKIYKWVRRAM